MKEKNFRQCSNRVVKVLLRCLPLTMLFGPLSCGMDPSLPSSIQNSRTGGTGGTGSVGSVGSVGGIGSAGSTAVTAEEANAGNATNVEGVTIEKGDCEPSANPSKVPDKGAKITEITVTFCVKIKNQNGKFQYDAKKWGFVFGGSNGEVPDQQPYLGDKKVEVREEGDSLKASNTERLGKVVMKIKFDNPDDDGKFPDTLSDLANGSGGVRVLFIYPYYAETADKPGAKGSVPLNKSLGIRLRNDRGALKNPPSISKVTVNDRSFVLEPTAPSKLDAENGDPAATPPTLVSVSEGSSVGGYLVMYWNVDECIARPDEWRFNVNPVYDTRRQNQDDYAIRRSLDSCVPQPTKASSGTCGFGCGTTPDASLFNQTAELVLQPKNIPSEDGKVATSGCYKVQRAAGGSKSIGIRGLTNGETYGVALFALDSSGRSGCKVVVPRSIPLASLEKGAETKESDCFVVTAASGSTNSRSVHTWRVIRDGYLRQFALGRFLISKYETHGPRWAHSLESAPVWIKHSLNFVLDWSGQAVFRVGEWWLASESKRAQMWEKFLDKLSTIVSWVGPAEARAEPPVSPPGSASSHLYLLGGVNRPTEDQDLYDSYYPSKRHYVFQAGQTFRVLDLMGELGLGAEFVYGTGRGKVPKKTVRTNEKIDEAVQGKEIGYYTLGFRLVADYAWRWDVFPYLRPRVAGFVGAQRFREQPRSVIVESDDNKTSEAADLPNFGAEGWSPSFGLRGGLQVSMAPLFGDDSGQVLYTYGVEDIAFHIQAGYSKDTASKLLRTSGIQLLAGFGFLFL
jgi:hypothetical protein